jgi:diguanylate cyclase (GGDEF)-like protein
MVYLASLEGLSAPALLAVTPISAKSGLPDSAERRTRRADLAARLKGRVRSLRAQLERREALLEAIREANATVDPTKVGGWLVHRARTWIPCPCWAVVARDMKGDLTAIAAEGLTPDLMPSLWVAAQWVMRHGSELLSGDLAKDSGKVGAAGSAIAFPLVCRNRPIGVLVGLDPVPSVALPALSAALSLAIRSILEPPAIALDNALSLQRAEAVSVTDDLTGLYNSRYLNQVLRRESKRASRSGRPLSLLFLDLDGFKQVNDTYGHLAGSKALVEAAVIIRGSARETDVAARFGGDEFSVVLPDTGQEGALSVAERIRDRICASQFLASDGLSIHLTASIGVATLPDVAASAEELLRAADVAMYRVKDAGKNGIHIAQEA